MMTMKKTYFNNHCSKMLSLYKSQVGIEWSDMKQAAAMMILGYTGAVVSLGTAVFYGGSIAEKKLLKDSGGY